MAARPLLEAGKSILLTVVADWVDDELKLRALSVADLDKAAADAGEGLRIYLEDTRPLNAIAGQLRQTGKGHCDIGGAGHGRPGSRNQTARPPAGHGRRPQRDQVPAGGGGGGDVVRAADNMRMKFPSPRKNSLQIPCSR